MAIGYKVDFHTHSDQSFDGGISADQYRLALDSDLLDCIAITDHGSISFAQQLHSEYGQRVIVGSEIETTDGDIVGLFLHKPVPSGLRADQAIRLIREQAGIVYIPHPFDVLKRGLHPETLEQLADEIDMIEVCDTKRYSKEAVVWARLNHSRSVVSSNAHHHKQLGNTYTILSELPTHDNLLSLLPHAKLITDRSSGLSRFYNRPARLKQLFKRKA